MDYYKAKAIRKSSLSDLIANKIIEDDSGILRSVGKSISEKTKARAVGIKEKFDPLNVAKMFGGKLGIAIAGRLTGRNQEDMSYFTGKRQNRVGGSGRFSSGGQKSMVPALYSNIAEVGSKAKNSKMKKGDSVTDVLARIYNLMKMSHDEEITRLELQKEKDLEAEKEKNEWNKELVEAIKETHPKEKKISEKVEEKKDVSSGLLSKILLVGLEKIAEKIGAFVVHMMAGIEKVIETIKNVYSMLKNIAKFLTKLGFINKLIGLFKKGGVLRLMLGFITSPFFLALAGAGILSYSMSKFLWWIAKNMEDYSMSQTEAKSLLNDPEITDDDLRKFGGRKRVEAIAGGANPSDVRNPDSPNYIEPEKQNVPPRPISGTGELSSAQKAWDTAYGGKYDPNTGKPIDPSKPLSPNMALPPDMTPSTAGAGRGEAQYYSKKAFKPFDPTNPFGDTVPQIPSPINSFKFIPPRANSLGVDVQKAIEENARLNLNAATGTVSIIDNSTSTTVGTGSGGSSVQVEQSAPVRNHEDTLSHVQRTNTRWV